MGYVLKPLRGFERLCANDDALHSPAECLGNVRLGSQSAAELAGDIHGIDNCTNALGIDWPALFRAVKIDEMKISRALCDPASGHAGGIAAEDGFLAVVALPQPHALAAANVDGRQNEHGVLPIRTRPARLETERR